MNGSKALEKTVNQENKCSLSDGAAQQHVTPSKLMKDPGLPSGFRSSQPFRAVHFGIDVSVFIVSSCKIGFYICFNHIMDLNYSNHSERFSWIKILSL